MNYEELHKPLFHGSNVSFTKIDLSKSAHKKDFGRGFYTTTDNFQAEKFARLKAKRVKADIGYVEVFTLSGYEGLKIKQFVSSDDEWFDFVLHNRGYSKLAEKAISRLSFSEVYNVCID